MNFKKGFYTLFGGLLGFLGSTSRKSERDYISNVDCWDCVHRMAMAGPPLSREDRLARQALANRLHLDPQICNMLVFGETPDDTGRPALTDTATCAPPPAQTNPQSLLGDG